MDGVYAPGLDGKPEFFALRPPENGEVRELAQLLAKRIPALLTRRGAGTLPPDEGESDRLARDQPWLSELYAASVSGRIATGPKAGGWGAAGGAWADPEGIDSSASPRCAAVAGFSLHGNVAIHAEDRSRLERLFRYAARPPLSMDRLEALPDGRLRYWFKTAWRNGTTHAIFEPLEFMEKLAALVPTPRAHLVRFHGLLAPAAKWRRPAVVPNNATTEAPLDSPDISTITAASSVVGPADGRTQKPANGAERRGRNYTWSELMKRVFAADVLACPDCGGRLRILSTIRPPEITRKTLDHLGIPSRPPPVAPAISTPLPFAFE